MRLRRHTSLNAGGFEDPVIQLGVPIPTVSADTGVIAEDPVSTDTIELSVPVPTVSVDTDVNENP